MNGDDKKDIPGAMPGGDMPAGDDAGGTPPAEGDAPAGGDAGAGAGGGDQWPKPDADKPA